MMKSSLFLSLLWRTLIILGATLVILYHVSIWLLGGFMLSELQRQLQDQASWAAAVAGHGSDPVSVAQDWTASHKHTRLQIFDPAGRTLFDSAPDLALPEGSVTVEAKEPMAGGGSLRLSEIGFPRHPWHNWFIPLFAVLIAIAGAVLYPLFRQLARHIEALSQAAHQIAQGRFGATLQAPPQKELAGLVSSFNDMSRQLADAEERQRRLISDVSHELRSPLGRLRALAETIERRPEEARPYLKQIDAEISLLDRLVGDMLDMARMEGGRDWLKRQTIPVQNWAADTFARCGERIRSEGISAKIETLPDGNGISADIDQDRLVQALGNLVDNAIAAVRDRNRAEIRLALRAEPSQWIIEVADNGGGIPADHLPYLFDRFYRAECHRGHRQGVGLGLSITRAIVEAHKGSIVIDSAEGHGTTVRLLLPRIDHTLS